MKKTSKQEIGQQGENYAAQYLMANGYQLLERNWRWKKAEVDLIAQKEATIVIIEVKTRTSTYFGRPEEFVTEKKLKFLLDAAQAYLMEKNLDIGIRIDIIGILFRKYGEPELNHFEDVYFPMF